MLTSIVHVDRSAVGEPTSRDATAGAPNDLEIDELPVLAPGATLVGDLDVHRLGVHSW